MINIRGLSFRYPGSDEDALQALSLQMREGSFTAIMGSNGSGKSTLARCMNGLLRPTSGSVEVDGCPTDDATSLQEVRRKVGMIFQDPNLQMTSVTVEREIAFGLENCGMARAEMRQRVNEEMSRFHLEQYRHISPAQLSAGEKQRLAIASVLALRPKYLILDEATSLLSGVSRNAVMATIMQLWKERGMAIILITQFPSEALQAERLIVLHQGRLLREGTAAAVFSDAASLHACGVPLPARVRIEQRL